MSQAPARRKLLLALAFSLTLPLGGCFLDATPASGDTVSAVEPPPPPPPPSGSATVDGTVFAAPVDGATVSVFAADANGLPTGAAIASALSNAAGTFSIVLPSIPGGAVVVVASGGTYTSEADGSTQTLGTLSALVPALAAGSNDVQISPLTNTIAAAAANLLAQGKAAALAEALATATTSVKTLVGLGALSADPLHVKADLAATSGDAWLLAALAGTLEQLRANATIAAADLYAALAADLSDGRIDGLKNGAVIRIGGSGPALQSSLFSTEWSGAANTFGTRHPAYQGATAGISGALQVAAQNEGVAIGSSGSIAPLVTQSAGTQIYFAARTDGLVALDMRDPANPAAAKMAGINAAVMLDSTAVPATGFFSSLDGIVINPTPITSGGATKVYALLYSYRSKIVASVNLTDGVLAETASLPITKTASFSGASAFIAGGIADGKRGKIWLATGDGLLGVDPSDLAAPTVLIPQPSGTRINENLGGDPAKDIVYSPDYVSNGLVVFNLAEARAYVMATADWRSATGNWNAGGENDGVALDSGYNVAVITPESGPTVGLARYATPAGASGAVGSIATLPGFMSFNHGSSFAGSAIDPVNHVALFVGEGTQIGVGVLDDPTHTPWLGFSKFVHTGLSSYRFEPHDPHTVGAFNVQGRSYGFLLQGSTSPYKVVVLDLAAVLAAPATAGTLASDPLLDPTLAKLLAY